MRIAIVGYGTAGQAAAIFLARDGHDDRDVRAQRRAETGRRRLPAATDRPRRVGRARTSRSSDRTRRAHRAAARRERRRPQRHGHALRRSRARQLRPRHDARRAVRAAARGVRAHGARSAPASASTRRAPTAADSSTTPAANTARSTSSSPPTARTRRCARRATLVAHAISSIRGARCGACCRPTAGRTRRELRQRYAGTRTMLGVLPVGTRPERGGRWLTFYYSLRGARIDAFDARRPRDVAGRRRRALARARRAHARADRSGAAAIARAIATSC